MTSRMTPTVKTIVIADVSVYLFYVLVRQSREFMEAHLALGPRLFAGEVWQPLTSLFVHLDFLGFLFSMIGLWFVGSLIERTQGTRRCFGLFLIGGVLANLAIAGVFRLRGLQPVSYDDGCGYAVVTLFVAFARLYGRQPAQIWPIPISIQSRYLVLILLGWQAAASLARSRWDSLAAMAVASLVGYLGAAPGGLAALRTAIANARDTVRARRIRRRFGVIDGGGRRPKKYVN